jgi:hypothetical protein
MLSVYFAACGLASKANDTTNALGLTMSQMWRYSAIEKLSEAKREHMKHAIHERGLEFMASYDNLNRQFQKFEQRLDNRQTFDSGCAATIYVIEHQDTPSPNAQAYRAQWERECKNPITPIEILDQDSAVMAKIFAFNKWTILNILLNSPPFDRSQYEHDDHPIFSRPEPVQQLPTGKKYVPTQYMLDTIHQEEVSLEGNDRCLDEWARQLSLDDEDTQRLLCHNRLFFYGADQLTVSRIRGLQKLHAHDLNWFDRLEHIHISFGWLHAQMAQEDSLHRQYFATGTGGLKQAFDLLQRKGLNSTSTQGNFHQKVHDAYQHILEAHVRDIWESVAKVTDLSELRKKTPEELDCLAGKIIKEYASTVAHYWEKKRPANQQDHVFMNQILLTQDLLDYSNLDDAMQTGDVGRMVDLIPRLLFRYHGGRNWKYAIEILELLQGLNREWPDDLRYASYYPYFTQ